MLHRNSVDHSHAPHHEDSPVPSVIKLRKVQNQSHTNTTGPSTPVTEQKRSLQKQLSSLGGDRPCSPPRVTLHSIITEYLYNQHALCKNPVVTCPQFNLFESGELSPITKYQQILHNGPEGWVRWGARLAFKPAAFALTAVTSLLPARQATDANGLPKASIDCTQRFVLESAVKDQATEFLNNIPPGEDRIGTIEELMRSCGFCNREVFEILLGYLVSQGMAVKSGDVVKLAEPNKKVTPVMELDEALVKLMSTETRLSGDMARLSREVAATDVEVRAALKLGNKLVAKNHLRKKLKAQQRLDVCGAALENVRELIQQAKNTDLNTEVVDTYRTSAQAMKRTMKDGGLEEDSVFTTMDNLKEVMDSYNEVERALGGTLDDLDTAEQEHELNELLAGSGGTGGTPGKEERAVGPKLPSPPAETPRKPGRRLERDFVFDGEVQMLSDLNRLDESSGKKVAIAEAVEETEPQPKQNRAKEKPSKDWDPTSHQSVSETWSNKLDSLAQSYGELRQDNRLHPGNIQVHPPTDATNQMLILRYLTAIGEYQEFLSHVFEWNALGLILGDLNVRESRDSRLAFEALKYLADSIDFINMGGLQDEDEEEELAAGSEKNDGSDSGSDNVDDLASSRLQRDDDHDDHDEPPRRRARII